MKSKIDSRIDQKLLVIGDNGVGKTSLIKALNGYNLTVDAITTHGINRSFDENLSVEIFDLGRAIDLDLKKELNKVSPDVVIIAVSARNENTTNSAVKWLEQIEKSSLKKDINKFIAITQTDIVNSNVSIDNYRLKESYNIDTIIRTSVKDKIGIHELRESIRSVISSPEPDTDEVAVVINKMIDSLCELVANNPRALESIEWRDLERIIARTLEVIGFSIELTPPAKDGGKDVIATCIIDNKIKTYFVEIKHWRSNSKVGTDDVINFIELNLSEKTDGGLFLSSYGFTKTVYKSLSKFMKQKIHLGEHGKIISLCKHYIKKKEGLWNPKTLLPEVLFEETLV